MPRFQLTAEAQHDLESAVDFLTAASSAEALRFLDDLENTFRFLTDWPNAGRHRRDLSADPHHRFWPAHGHLIGYDPHRRPLLIFCVLHGARDAMSILSDRP